MRNQKNDSHAFDLNNRSQNDDYTHDTNPSKRGYSIISAKSFLY